ncbi:uncharacterized protein LOC124272681 [Haliotis rubra]|uniref:uncharacterized protein LOC124272681 n=1 Tax=Haliotis rubra TaxID=36100 RepID=UPI001EE4EB51|nr:uncharacterized protein LOC124272681 [Haliotis rubra]
MTFVHDARKPMTSSQLFDVTFLREIQSVSVTSGNRQKYTSANLLQMSETAVATFNYMAEYLAAMYRHLPAVVTRVCNVVYDTLGSGSTLVVQGTQSARRRISAMMGWTTTKDK